MVTTTIPNAAGSTAPEDAIEIELKQPMIAALLAWALPGLGHVYQGRTGKGLLFFVCVLGTFFYGLYLGGGKVVYAAVPWEQQYRWQYWCQLGVGLAQHSHARAATSSAQQARVTLERTHGPAEEWAEQVER